MCFNVAATGSKPVYRWPWCDLNLITFFLLSFHLITCKIKELDQMISCCCSVGWPCLTLCDPMDCSTPAFPVLYHLPELAQTHVHWVSDPTNHLVLCCPLLFLPSVFPSISVFSNKSALHIRWPKCWIFSFSISPANEYSGLIPLRIDCFDLLVVQETLKSLLQHYSSKFFSAQPSLWSNSHIHTWLLARP